MLLSTSQLPAPGRLFLPGCAIAAGLLAVSSPVFAAPTSNVRPKLVATSLGAPMTLRVGKVASYPLQPSTTFTLLNGAEKVFCEVKNGTLTVKGMSAGLVKMRLNTPGRDAQIINLKFVEGRIQTDTLAQVVERAPVEGTAPIRQEPTTAATGTTAATETTTVTETTASSTSEQAPNSNLGAVTTGGPVTGLDTTTSTSPSTGGTPSLGSGPLTTSPLTTSPLSTDLGGEVAIPTPPAPSLPALNTPLVDSPPASVAPVRSVPQSASPRAATPVRTVSPVRATTTPRAPQISPSLPAPARNARANVAYRTTPSLPRNVASRGAASRRTIGVTQGLARLLSFPSNILAVFFSDPNVMDARAINARTIAVTGVGAGPSTLAVFTSRYPGDAIGQANIYRIQTTGKNGAAVATERRDPRIVESAINSALNDPRIRAAVITLPDGSVAARLSGTVRNEAEVQAAVTTASFYVPKVVSSLYVDPTALTLDAALSNPLSTEGALQENLRRITGNNTIEILPLPTGLAFKAEVDSAQEAESLLRVLPTLNQQVIPFIVIRGQENSSNYFNATIPVLSAEDRQLTQKLQDVTGIRSVYVQRTSGNSVAIYGNVRTRTEYDTVRRYGIIVGQIQVGGGGGGATASAPAYDITAAYQRNLGIQMFVRITDPLQSVIRKVTVETSVVEISRTDLRNLGAEYGTVNVLSESVTGGTQIVTNSTTPGVPPTVTTSPIITTRTIDPTFTQGAALAGTGFAGGQSLSNINPFRVRLNALFNNGNARLLSQPNVTSVEGSAAQITIGGERPVPKAVATQGAVGTQVEFRRFGVIISMRPTVTGDNTIILQIRADVTQPDRTFEINLGGALIPGETVRSVDTTVNVRPGDTVIMGGLITNEKRQALSKVPILGDIPIIGSLFRSKRFDNNETELAIFLTPRIEATQAGMEEIEALNRVPALPPLPSRQESNSILFQETTRTAG